MTAQVKQNLLDNGVPVADRIPIEHTDIQIVSAARADQLRQSFIPIEPASIWPAVGTVVVALLAVVLAGA
ncbi:hypothetical protein ACYJ2M_39495, partial [Streptomyces sp. DT9]